MHFFLTKAQRDDVSKLAELERLVFVPSDGKITKRSFLYHINKDKNLLLVAKLTHDPNALLGYLLVFVHRKSARIYSLAIHPHHQKKGIGKALLQRAIEYILNLGITNIHLELRENNKKAFKLYELLGFVVQGKRYNYYGLKENAILMIWKHPM